MSVEPIQDVQDGQQKYEQHRILISNATDIVNTLQNFSRRRTGTRNAQIREEYAHAHGAQSEIATNSTFFASYLMTSPTCRVIKLPKTLIPGTTVKEGVIKQAIDFLHGNDLSDNDVFNHCAELILIAQELGIAHLQYRVSKHLEQTLERNFQGQELTQVLQLLYSNFRNDADVGNGVVSVVTGAAARVCRKKLATLEQNSEFEQLLKDVPQLAIDIVKTVAKENQVEEAMLAELSSKKSTHELSDIRR